jgi:hypothetical protein
MKTKFNIRNRAIVLLCVAALVVGPGTTRSLASTSDPGSITVDVLLVRPLCFVATICGGAIFVVSLPFAAASKSVPSAARALVVKPAQATFTRPLGDLDDMSVDEDF